MYESPETPQPLFDLAAGLARAMTPREGPRPTIEVGPFPTPLTDQQRNGINACWALARLRGIPVDHIATDAYVHLIAYPEGR